MKNSRVVLLIILAGVLSLVNARADENKDTFNIANVTEFQTNLPAVQQASNPSAQMSNAQPTGFTTNGRSYPAGKFGLAVGNQDAGWIHSAEGGQASADVVESKVGPGVLAHAKFSQPIAADHKNIAQLFGKPLMEEEGIYYTKQPSSGQVSEVKVLSFDKTESKVLPEVGDEVDKQVPWQKHKNAEGDAPTLEFTAAEPMTMQVDLMFDTYEEKTTVGEGVKLGGRIADAKIEGNFDFKKKAKSEFGEALITETTIPEMDGSSKDMATPKVDPSPKLESAAGLHVVTKGPVYGPTDTADKEAFSRRRAGLSSPLEGEVEMPLRETATESKTVEASRESKKAEYAADSPPKQTGLVSGGIFEKLKKKMPPPAADEMAQAQSEATRSSDEGLESAEGGAKGAREAAELPSEETAAADADSGNDEDETE